MITYKCLKCSFTFTEADRAWDVAVETGLCPNCKREMSNFPIPKTTIVNSSKTKLVNSKYAKVTTISGVSILLILKMITGMLSSHHSEAFHSEPIRTELTSAIDKDDWSQVQATYKECKIEVDEKGNKSWLPFNCAPFLMIHESITAKAQHVYHGLANENAYGLESSWREREAEYFPNSIQ